MTVGVLIMVFVAVTALSIYVQDESTDRNILLSKEIRCVDFSGTINTVYSNGRGTEFEFETGDNFTVGPGIIMLEGQGEYFCAIDQNAVKTTQKIAAGKHILKNDGYEVKIL